MTVLNTGSMAAYHQLPRQKTWCWGPLHPVRSLLLLLPTHVNLTQCEHTFSRVIFYHILYFVSHTLTCIHGHVFKDFFYPCWVNNPKEPNFLISMQRMSKHVTVLQKKPHSLTIWTFRASSAREYNQQSQSVRGTRVYCKEAAAVFLITYSSPTLPTTKFTGTTTIKSKRSDAL